ncbi:TPA: SymE family type I addiction module toxin [Stenotrophomonas maltophilia]|nr:SymE family type I addiction module toxin [Stenotrophomonas maltophilia]
MRSSKMESCNDPSPQVGIGWYQPKSLRISALRHPAGNILPPDLSIPYLSLCGVWLERLGFKTDHPVFVEVAPGRVTLTLDETPVPLPYRYRYRKHDPKKERSRKGRSEQ